MSKRRKTVRPVTRNIAQSTVVPEVQTEVQHTVQTEVQSIQEPVVPVEQTVQAEVIPPQVQQDIPNNPQVNNVENPPMTTPQVTPQTVPPVQSDQNALVQQFMSMPVPPQNNVQPPPNAQQSSVPFLVATQQSMDKIDNILMQMKQPINNNQNTLIKLQRVVLKEILEITQKQLLLNRAGKPNGVKHDSVGWTTASTDYSNPEVVAKLPHAVYVNQILEILLKEQEKEAQAHGSSMSQQQIINAQNDALDKSKKDVVVEMLPDPTTQIQSRLVMSKENGDTQLQRKNPETGFWETVGGVLKNFCTNVWNFAKGIYSWLKEKMTSAWGWLCGLFQSPAEVNVIKNASK